MGYHYRTDILANLAYNFAFGAALQNLHVSYNNSKCYCRNKLYKYVL